MKKEIKVPAMGESISEATIGQIIQEPGSSVKADDELLELETDKVTQVLFAPASGVFNLSVKSDDVVQIGDVIGHIDTEGAAEEKEEKKEVEEKEEEKKEEKVVEEKKKPEPKREEPSSEGARVSKDEYVKELGKKEEASTKETPAPKPRPVDAARETRKRMPKIRKVIAKRLVEALHESAMLTTFNEVDMSKVMELRAETKEEFTKKHGVKLGFMSFFVKAAVSALREFPLVNAYIDGEEIVERNYYDVSIAVGTDKGLIVPVLRDCDKLSFAEIEKGIREFAEKARGGTLTPDDLQGGGFTITNGGVYGSLLSTPILNRPQSAILGMHKIEKRPVVVDDEIVIRPMMYLALSYDHRIVDGKEAVSFLVHMKNMLEDPARLLLGV